MSARLTFLSFIGVFALVGCGGSSSGSDTPANDAGVETATSGDDGATPSDTNDGSDTTPTGDDASADTTPITPDTGPVDAPAADAPTGACAVTRLPCVGRTGLATDLPFNQSGAIEANVVAIGCAGDPDHLHVQIAVADKRYDVALVVYDSKGGAPIGIYEKDIPAKTAPAGWSNATFSYPRDLGIHSTDFTMLDKTGMTNKLKADLANASCVSIHGKSYTDGTGVHDVHYYDGSRDGVVILRHGGAGGTDHAIAMRYSSMTF